MKVLKATNDYCFAKVFYNNDEPKSKSPEILIDFINSVTRRTGDDEVTAIEYNKSELFGPAGGTTLVPDLLCATRNGEFFVEMQLNFHEGLLEQVQMYGARLLGKQLEKETNYHLAKPITVIVICNFDALNNGAPLSIHQMLDTTTHKRNLIMQEFVFVQLSNFNGIDIETFSREEMWMFYFTKTANEEVTDEELEVIERMNPLVKDAIKLLNKSSHTADQLLIYHFYEQKAVYREKCMATAEHEGITEERVRIARRMLEENYSAQAVGEITSLPIDLIAAIII